MSLNRNSDRKPGNSLSKPKSININGSAQGFVKRTDQLDFYQFTLTARSSFSATMNGLKANADLALLNRSGQAIVQSRKSASKPELIRSTLEAGTYFLRVMRRGGDTRYRLKWSSTELTKPDPAAELAPDPAESAKPDLTGLSFKIPGTLTAGQPFTVDFAIQNIGSAPAASSRISFYLSEDPNITTGDRLLGSYDYTAPIAAGKSTELLSAALSLPNTKSNFFWNDQSTYYVGMAIDSNPAIPEANLSNNTNAGAGIDYTAIAVSGVPADRPFKIKFDYRFDTNNWFTAERRATLESAARIWETVIQSDFPDIPAGQTLTIPNPQPVFTSSNTYTRQIANVTLESPVDDVVIFVGAGAIGNVVAGIGGPSVSTGNSALIDRFTGSPFQPYTGSILFTTDLNWFFDPTPNTADDLPANQTDFLSIALHEIGHVLGFGAASAFTKLIVNGAFTGANAVRANGGSPVPLSDNDDHIQSGYQSGNSGEMLMDPENQAGSRQLPTLVDIAMLEDIGYAVNYSAASQNKPG